MAKVKCEYCGTFFEDTAEFCNYCGAPNGNYQRLASDTPKTIEQLQSWYVARKLPPENITRFFIGKDIREPKAFGIYKKEGKFIVYKNKANGQRAIRYEGTDEAYAVNELYMKLKEEILRQKNLNYNHRQQNSSHRHNLSSRSQSSFRVTSRKMKFNSRPKSVAFVVLISMLISIIFIGLMFTFLGGNLFLDWDNGMLPSYYVSTSGEVYYCVGEGVDNKCAWWVFDKNTEEWQYYEELDKNTYPEFVDKDDRRSGFHAVAEELNLNEEKVNIYNWRPFIDAGNHRTPSTSYYFYNDNLYYYLDDIHSSYGSDNSGWYIYRNNNWEYYCSEDAKEMLGDELWYSDNKYSLGTDYSNMYDFVGDLADTWHPTNFEDTSWYRAYEANNNAYQQEVDDRNNHDNWDNDSDYDWDDDYDWDSDSGDWDSDW